MPSFPASDKSKDTRYGWFTRNHGHECWELDALDPNLLRQRVREEIEALIEPVAWARCKNTEKAEHESLRSVLNIWNGGDPKPPEPPPAEPETPPPNWITEYLEWWQP